MADEAMIRVVERHAAELVAVDANLTVFNMSHADILELVRRLVREAAESDSKPMDTTDS